MQIGKQYKLEKVTSSAADKHILSHILVENNQAMASNGSVVAVVPCALSKKDKPGPITQDSLTYARKHTLGDKCLAVSLASAEHLVCEDTTEFPRSCTSFVDSSGDLFRETPQSFPDVMSVIPPPHYDDVVLTLNPSLLRSLASALGDADFIRLHLHTSQTESGDGHISGLIRVSSHQPDEFGCIGTISA